VSLPAADELFRNGRHSNGSAREISVVRDEDDTAAQSVAGTATETAAEKAARRSSGRVRHDEKMTVYVTADELLDIEHARLSMRRHQGLAVDRGRLVREAIAIALEDLEANGGDSILVQRLIGQ
jgi:hypothetical protein